MLKNEENNGMEEIVPLTPTPARFTYRTELLVPGNNQKTSKTLH